MIPVHARNLHSVLAQTSEYAELAARLDAMVALQQIIQTQWPGLQLRVLSVRDGVLALGTPSAALAAKARQSEPSMLAAVRRSNPTIREIRYKPDKAQRGQSAAPVSTRNREIGEESLEQLQFTASQLEAGPVRDALQRLIRRQLSG